MTAVGKHGLGTYLGRYRQVGKFVIKDAG